MLKLHKREKLCSQTAIDALFAGNGAKGALAFPLRVIFRQRTDGALGVRFFISVPKKKLRKAVDRVTMRRRIREAYRLNRNLLPDGADFDVAFIYVAAETLPYARVESAVKRLLPKLSSEDESAE
ncbi:MAG: ribonuclease P protein component [Bacteroidales bacterium]|nr:ribonuclease P protein component [Bacteroidales bacterium]